ncbi:hypothetical protein ACQRIT_000314 [Beauveria bassiana]
MKTIREHSEHALEMCDRIKQKPNHDNVAVALDKMSLEDDEAALVQTIQPGGGIHKIREHFRKRLEDCNSSPEQIEIWLEAKFPVRCECHK